LQNLIKGLKNTLFSLVLTALVFFTLLKTQSHWLSWLPVIDTLLYGLLVIAALFAAQFNRSRFTLLACAWLVYYLHQSFSFSWSPWLANNQDWQLLTGLWLLALLSLIKDRGLISVHGLSRIFFVLGCGALAYLWLLGYEHGVTYLASQQISFSWLDYLALELPLVLVGLWLLVRSLFKASLTDCALLVSFIVWGLDHYQMIALPLSLVLSVLACHYLLVVVIDSYFLAYRDELTGLPSRRALNQLALSLGRKYTLAMMDIDHFKKFNDTYGHDIGDQVLKLVASKLAKVKSGGKVFRYGGEEFTVVFPRKSVEQSIAELEALRQSIADYKMVIRKPQRKTKQDRKGKKTSDMKTVSVTISIGVAQRSNKQKFEKVLKEADLALYRAKKAGRNNVSQ